MSRCDAKKCGVPEVTKTEAAKPSVVRLDYPTVCPECKSRAVSKLCKCMLENNKACSDYKCVACKLRWHYCRETGENVVGEIVEGHIYCKRCDDICGAYKLTQARKKYEELLAKYGGSGELKESKLEGPRVDLDALTKLNERVAEMHALLAEINIRLDELPKPARASKVAKDELDELAVLDELGDELEDEFEDELD